MITIQNYARAESLQQAYELDQNERNRVLGGTLWLKSSNIMVPTDDEVRAYLAGNLCRRSGYDGQRWGIRNYLDHQKA